MHRVMINNTPYLMQVMMQPNADIVSITPNTCGLSFDPEYETSIDKNELWLFLGTTHRGVLSIVHHDMKAQKRKVSDIYGHGLYFTDQFEVARQRSEDLTEDGCYYVVLCKVLMGRVCESQKELRGAIKPPCARMHKKCKCDDVQYDSVIGLMSNPIEYVVYDERRVLPMFIYVVDNA